MPPLVTLPILSCFYPAPVLAVTAQSVNTLVPSYEAAVKRADLPKAVLHAEASQR